MAALPWHHILSGLVTLAYLGAACFMGGVGLAAKVLLGLLLPLAAIWLPDEMGGMLMGFGGTRPAINETSPGCLVRFMGWTLLLLPLFIPLLTRLLAS